ncbi:putative transporter ESBP6 [Nakaseomyces bracarensis]|uniref:Transporter ESBP6 n=1 Tax=Nakaseomyces bracarensis TaxID=273131 RepID=A0ABR4NP74_9SACH
MNSDSSSHKPQKLDDDSVKADEGGIWRALTEDGRSILDSFSANVGTDLDDVTDEQLEHDERNKILESRFDVADAMRLHEQSEVDGESVGHEAASVAASRRSYNSGSDLESGMSCRSRQDDENQSLEKVPTIKKVFTNKDTGELDLPPDGGYGWVCAFCVFLVMFSTWGCNSGFGVFLGFYLNNDTYPGASKYDYAFTAGLTVFLGQGLAPFVMVLMRVIGLKPTMLFGDALLLAGFLLASFSKKIWQLYLTQGVLAGAAISLVFVPATAVIPGWFLKRRAIAMGISLLGTGAGGVTYGLAVNKMIQNDGNTRWALRILAITCSISIIVATALIKERKPFKPVGLKHPSLIKDQFILMFRINLIQKPYVLLIATWFAFALFAYNLMIFTLSPYAIARGMSSHDAATLTAILNGSQAIGRPCMGFAGDKFGRTNVTIVLTCCLSIFMYAFWIPAHTMVQLIFFSICVGSCVGVANVMSTVLIADMAGPKDFLPAWAFVNYAGCPLLLFTEVIAQALTVPSHKSNPYLHTQVFAGSCFTFALFLACLLREYIVRIKYTQKYNEIDKKLEEYSEDTEKHSIPTTIDSSTFTDDERKLREKRDHYKKFIAMNPGAFLRRMTHKMIV